MFNASSQPLTIKLAMAMLFIFSFMVAFRVIPAMAKEASIRSISEQNATREDPQPTATILPTPTPAILIGAGDIALCDQVGDSHTASTTQALLQQYPDAAVFTAGDNAQVNGAMIEYTHCFQETWGQFLDRIHPSPGNHDWYTDQGAPYFTYFGAAAGEPGLGYYSYDLGAWHIVSLNSNCDFIDCGSDSAQARWLKADLQTHPTLCTLVYWHHPLWDSGTVEISTGAKYFWQIASDAGADIVVNGHDHHYERFTPLNRDGKPDPNGIRPFILGTGGAWLFVLNDSLPITEMRNNTTHGVMLFTLYEDHYEWDFVPSEPVYFQDSGSGVCH